MIGRVHLGYGIAMGKLCVGFSLLCVSKRSGLPECRNFQVILLFFFLFFGGGEWGFGMKTTDLKHRSHFFGEISKGAGILPI